MEPSIEVRQLLNHLNSPFSSALWRESGTGLGDVQVNYIEATGPVFKVLFNGLQEGNLDVCSFIARNMHDTLQEVYAGLMSDYEAAGQGPGATVSTPGFQDACERVLERNADLARNMGLSVELQPA